MRHLAEWSIGGIMEHFRTSVIADRSRNAIRLRKRTIPTQRPVLIVCEDDKNNDYLEAICEFLDISMEHAASGSDLGPLLLGLRPIALVADLDGDVQDGLHVMKMVAGYDQRLPVLLLTGNQISLEGGVDAVKEILGLNHVATATDPGSIGDVVDFLCYAARNAGRSRMMRT
jgi:CheY-like chemotaxis protein